MAFLKDLFLLHRRPRVVELLLEAPLLAVRHRRHRRDAGLLLRQQIGLNLGPAGFFLRLFFGKQAFSASSAMLAPEILPSPTMRATNKSLK